MDPSSTITESLAHIHKFTASSDSFDYSSLKPSLPTVIGGDRSVDDQNSHYQSRFNEDGAFRSLNDPLNGSNLQRDQPNITHSPPNTDLRMDWADACSLGRLPSLNRYFLMILDKDTKYWATYPSKTRGTGTPVELLKQYITTTGRTPRYLRIDNAREYFTRNGGFL